MKWVSSQTWPLLCLQKSKNSQATNLQRAQLILLVLFNFLFSFFFFFFLLIPLKPTSASAWVKWLFTFDDCLLVGKVCGKSAAWEIENKAFYFTGQNDFLPGQNVRKDSSSTDNLYPMKMSKIWGWSLLEELQLPLASVPSQFCLYCQCPAQWYDNPLLWCTATSATRL